MGRLFGTDGVRGKAGTFLSPELAFALGRAGAYVLSKEKHHAPKIIIGRDTRLSGYMLESALAAGMCSVGANVVLAGIIPTPAIAYLTRKYGCDAGVVISASHNPFDDNGIKFFNSDGYKLIDSLEEEIEELVLNHNSEFKKVSGADIGSGTFCNEALQDYMDYLKAVAGDIRLSGLKVAVDAANGATSVAAVSVLHDLGAEVLIIHNEPDGLNINSGCGSTHMESLAGFVQETKADIGIAFDGDGDRCLMTDENGNVASGDEILSICGNFMKDEGKLKNNTIVATVMSNLGLMLMGRKYGIDIEKTDVGDRYVLERMLQGGYSLGGEQSGHVIFLEYNTTGDGILTALQILKIMKKTGKKLSELNTYMDVMPQVLLNARVNNMKKHDYIYNNRIRAAIQEVEDKFKGGGRVLIRPSGTEPLVRIMIEGPDKAMLQTEALRLKELIEKLLI